MFGRYLKNMKRKEQKTDVAVLLIALVQSLRDLQGRHSLDQRTTEVLTAVLLRFNHEYVLQQKGPETLDTWLENFIRDLTKYDQGTNRPDNEF